MRSIVAWSVKNWQAMNVVMLGILLLGAFSLSQLRRDFWPDFELYNINISVVYPGATPDEIEEGILEKIEEAIRSVDGIDEMTSTGREGVGNVMLELDPDTKQTDAQSVLTEVTTLIAQIPSFPEYAEKPSIGLQTNFTTAIRVAVMGPENSGPEAGSDAEEISAAALELRRIAEQVRLDVLALPSVSVADLVGSPDYQIDIEIPEKTLRKFNLSLAEVASIVAANNVELPGGTLRSESQEILLRGSDKSSLGSEIAEIPLVTQPDGTVLRVGDLGQVRDEFAVEGTINEVNGRPAILVSVETTSADDIVQVADEVKAYVQQKQAKLPTGYSMIDLRDRSKDVRSRLEMLTSNAISGLILVFIVLALFLEMRLAWWVVLGIPISLLGACIYMLYGGQTLNMTTMFAFLIALGIVVDDAIVVGENIYAHRQMGKSYRLAAIDGATEVMPSIITAVMTTVIAFAPIMYMEGRIKRMTVVLPMCVGAILLLSMFESLTILPAHLCHRRSRFLDVLEYLLFPLKPLAWLIGRANAATAVLLNWFVDRVYTPVLGWSLSNPAIVLSALIGMMILSAGVVRSGRVPFLLLPKIDFGFATVQVTYPDGTPIHTTTAATKRLEDAIWVVNQRTIDEGLTDDPNGVVIAVQRTVGSSGDEVGATMKSHVGGMFVQLSEISERSVSSEALVRMWREEAGRFPGAEAVAFAATPRGPAGSPIEMRLLAAGENLDQLDDAIAMCQAKLAEYAFVTDIATDTLAGKWEYRFKIQDDAKSMGISLADVAGTVRASYYGEEVMRLQRGRHEVPLRVRYPRSERNSLASLDNIRIRGSDQVERPLSEVADVDVQQGYSEIKRIDQMRSISVIADVDETRGNAFNVVADLKANFVDEFNQAYPGIRLEWAGQQEQTDETMSSLVVGFMFVLGAMFLLLTIQFNSCSQAILILTIVPFGVIGAIVGHVVMDIDLTLFSIFGIVALGGVVVNDSIVLVDFINKRVADGLPVRQAIVDGSRRRFRAVLLTSVTTCAGMLPILLERSKQAQVVAPMATSLTFGLALSTVVVLILAPVMYLLMAHLTGTGQRVDVEHLSS